MEFRSNTNGHDCRERPLKMAGEEGIEPSLTRVCNPPLYDELHARYRLAGSNRLMTGSRPVAFPFGLAGECWSRKQGSDEAYETSALPLSYSAPWSSNSCMWLPLLDSNQALRVQSPVPCQLGEGATPYQPLSLAARRTLLLLGRAARIELAWSAWKVAALPLSTPALADGAGVEPARPEGLDALAAKRPASRTSRRPAHRAEP